MKYIDAEKLIHDLEERMFAYSEGYAEGDDNRKDAIETLLKDVKYQLSLQQEQTDLDDIKREWYNKGYLKGRQDAYIPARELGLPKSLDFYQEQQEVDLERDAVQFCFDKGLNVTPYQAKTIASHFYELGKNSK